MTMKKIAAVLLSALMMLSAFAGCADREKANDSNNTGQTQPETLPEEQPNQPEEPTSPETDKKEEKSDKEEKEQTVPTLSTDFSEIGGLDNTTLGWGPGGPVDEHNRSQGAVAYQEKYGKYNADFIAEDGQKVYLTFDEGYENGYTPKILDVLKEKNCPAVFFVTMPYAKSNPELIQRMIDEGHVVGSHSVNHLIMPELSHEEQYNEIAELHQYIKDTFDYDMNLFRYPTGAFSEQSLALVQKMGYRSVFWSFAYKDWLVDEQPDPVQALQTLKDKMHPGAIYLLHAVSSTNTQILGDFIDYAREQGYEFSDYIV